MGIFKRAKPASPQDAFADEMAALIRALPQRPRVARRDDFALDVSHNGKTSVLNLTNFFAEAQQLTGEARESRLRTAALSLVTNEAPAGWDEAQPRLRLAVRSPSWMAAPGSQKPISRPLVPFVLSVVAIDSEHGMSFVNAKDLAEWGIDADTAFAVAEDNLVRGGLPLAVAEAGDDRAIVVHGPDGYGSSWLACPQGLLQTAREHGIVLPILIAASREDVIVQEGASALAAERIEAGIEAFLESPRQLSPVPYVLDETGAVPWDPEPGHPCAGVVHKAKTIVADVEYRYQHQALVDLYEAAGEDVFVAKHSVVQRPDGTLFSWCAWVKEVTDGSMPRTDFINLGCNETEERFWVRWEDAERLAPEALVRDATLFPPRWRVTGWPEGGELRRLRRAAVERP